MIRLAVRVARPEAELVLAELLELAPAGVEEVAIGAEIVEYAVYGTPGELPELPALRAAAGGALIDVRSEEIADDWSQRWRAFHRPLVLGDRLTVRPPWESPGATALDVVIDPGQAFGTGAHATTRLCLELMLELGTAARSLVDLGCGSGVLAIAGAALGFAPVTALDYDPAAVAATEENARSNGVALDVRLFDMRRAQVPDADLVVANVFARPLVAWAAYQARLAPRLILSGILIAEADRVASAFAERGRPVTDRRDRGEWTALALGADRGEWTALALGADRGEWTALAPGADRGEWTALAPGADRGEWTALAPGADRVDTPAHAILDMGPMAERTT